MREEKVGRRGHLLTLHKSESDYTSHFYNQLISVWEEIN